MKNIKILLGIFFILCLLPMVIADDSISAITITAPSTTASYVGGTYTFTGTYVGNSSGNISFFYNGTLLCADTTVTTVNGTASCSKDTSGITDGLYPNFNATARNSTGQFSSDSTVWTIYFDNTDPVISSFSTNAIMLEPEENLDYTCTATDTQDASLTYSVVLTQPMNLGTVTRTTATGNFNNADTSEEGIYTLSCTVTDDAGNTDVETQSITFDPEGKVIDVKAVEEESNMKSLFLIIMFIVVIVAVIVVFYIINDPKKGKKRKKRR